MPRAPLGAARRGRRCPQPRCVENTHFAACGRSRAGRVANYDHLVPLYEFACRSCGRRFEELVGSHVGVEEAGVSCPQCGAAGPERLISPVSPPGQGLTPGQKRRLEDKRGTDRGGARERFGKQRDAERSQAKGRRG